MICIENYIGKISNKIDIYKYIFIYIYLYSIYAMQI